MLIILLQSIGAHAVTMEYKKCFNFGNFAST